MTHEKRLWIAVALSMALVIVWNLLFPPPAPKKKPVPDVTSLDTSILSDTIPTATLVDMNSESVATFGDSSYQSFGHAPRIGAMFHAAAPGVELDFAETGGVIADLKLTDYGYVTPDHHNDQVALVHRFHRQMGHLAVVMEESDRSGMAESVWDYDSSAEIEGRPAHSFATLPHASELPRGIELVKRYRTGDQPYTGEFELEVANKTSVTVAFSTGRLEYPLQGTSSAGSFLLHLGPGLGHNRPAEIYRSQYDVSGAFGADGEMKAAVLEKSWYHGFFGAPEAIRDAEWVALQNRYFAVAALPDGFKIDANFTKNANGELDLWILLPAFQLEAGATRIFRFQLFSGPKRTELLSQFNSRLRPLDGMEPSIFPSQIAFARWMVGFLGLIESHVGNWGLSIVILTVIIRIILFPLSHYQFKSMAKMSKLKPKIDKIQSQYADDKERLQRELMNVYREAGVNPLGGCLPIFVQMPILVGLFLALQNSIELRGAAFGLWIKDLATPDTLFWVVGIPLNPLPIAMGATMILQQKLTPTPTADPNQRQMFTIMTVVMTVMFYNFPSGLSLYWLTQNILSIAQQYYMLKRKEE